MTERISATINGKLFTGEVPAEELLLDFLRDRLGLTGAKQSCEVRSPTSQDGTSLVSASIATQVHTSP